MADLVEVSQFDATVHSITDGENVNAAVTNLAPQALANRTKYLKAHADDATGAAHGAVSTKTANKIVRRDATGAAALDIVGNVTGNASGSSGSCTGNAATATDADKLDGQHGSYYAVAKSDTKGSGYQQLPNGLIIQWGTVSMAGAAKTVTLPIAFPSAFLSIVGTGSFSTLTNYDIVTVYRASLSQFQIALHQVDAYQPSRAVDFIAIGY